MHKLRLQMDDLRVESFETTAAARAKGTVFGEQCTCYTECTCPGCPTCDATCGETCGNTCDASCAYTCAYTCDDVSCGGTCGGNSCYGTCYMDATCVGPRTCLC